MPRCTWFATRDLPPAAFDKAVPIPSSAIHAYVEKLRKRNPYASPEQTIRILEGSTCSRSPPRAGRGSRDPPHPPSALASPWR